MTGILDLLLAEPGGRRAQALPPGMDRADIAWHANLSKFVSWRSANEHCWPSNSPNNPDEKRIATWLNNQRSLQKSKTRGRWSAERKTSLDIACPGWEGEDVESKWANTLADLVAWRKGHKNQLPAKDAKNPHEKRLGGWLHNQRKAQRGITRAAWSAERKAALDIACPGWEGEDVESKWANTLADLVAWRKGHKNRWPTNNAGDLDERRLAAWIRSQRSAQKGQGAWRWSAEREAALNAACQGWNRVERTSGRT